MKGKRGVALRQFFSSYIDHHIVGGSTVVVILQPDKYGAYCTKEDHEYNKIVIKVSEVHYEENN